MRKKGQFQMVINISLLLVAFIIVGWVISYFMNEADERSSEEICRGSIGLRQVAHLDVAILKDPKSPLICKTNIKEVPEKVRATPDEVKKSFANMVERCWWMFGEGMVEDVFDGSVFTNKCFVCYQATVKDDPKFTRKNGDIIKKDELMYHFVTTPKETQGVNDGCYMGKGECIPKREGCSCGYCPDYPRENPVLTVPKKGRCPDRDGEPYQCCVGHNDCEDKGGKCLSGPDPELNGYTFPIEEYDYDCEGEGLKCYFKREDVVTTLDYVQDINGEGSIAIFSDIEPGETYSVAMMSPSDDCGKLCVATGIATAIVAGSLTLAICTATAPVCFILAGTMTVGGAYYGSQDVATVVTSVDDLVDQFKDRKVSTIAIGDKDVINEFCSVVTDTQGD